ncbi:ADP-ribosylation [Hortaea werneckii]|nr:ADP-ribosylation [Hortaea werneckii]
MRIVILAARDGIARPNGPSELMARCEAFMGRSNPVPLNTVRENLRANGKPKTQASIQPPPNSGILLDFLLFATRVLKPPFATRKDIAAGWWAALGLVVTGLAQRVAEPFETFVQTVTGGGASGLDVLFALGALPQAVETQLVRNLGRVHRVRQILLVGEDQQERISQLVLVQHALQLFAGLNDTVTVIAVDDEDDTLGVLEVVPPQRSDLVLSTNIPDRELDVLVLDRIVVTISPSLSLYRMVAVEQLGERETHLGGGVSVARSQSHGPRRRLGAFIKDAVNAAAWPMAQGVHFALQSAVRVDAPCRLDPVVVDWRSIVGWMPVLWLIRRRRRRRDSRLLTPDCALNTEQLGQAEARQAPRASAVNKPALCEVT